MLIRSVELRDVDAITDIYNGYVTGGSATFETEPVGTAEMRSRIAGISARFPYLVCEEDGQLLGYAYASSHHERAAYAWNAELSIYVRPQCQRRGIAGALCRSVIEILRLLGYRSLYSRITIPNPASLALPGRANQSRSGPFPPFLLIWLGRSSPASCQKSTEKIVVFLLFYEQAATIKAGFLNCHLPQKS